MQYYDSVKLYLWLAISMVLTFLFFSYAVYLDFTPEWKNYQKEFIQLKIEKMEKDLAEKQTAAKDHPEAMKQELQEMQNAIQMVRRTPIRIEQLIVDDLKKVDRCVTCHMGILDPKFENAKQPFKTHPHIKEIFGKNHPVEKFACTVCHEGQGHATTVKTAHGFVHHWEYPMLEKEYIQISCGKCHDANKHIPMAPMLKKGSDVIHTSICLTCHKIWLEGPQKNAPCPELSKEGGKREYEYDYFNVDDRHKVGHNSILSWHYEHFSNPSKVSPGTTMPSLFTSAADPNKPDEEKIKAVTIYVLSLKDVERERIPAWYLRAWDLSSSTVTVAEEKSGNVSEAAPLTSKPAAEVKKTKTAAAAPPAAGGADAGISLDEGKKVFDTNCVSCHGAQGKGDGPAAVALNPKPADFTDKEWKYGAGEENILKTVSKGVPGTAMPAWEASLSETQRKSVAQYIWKTLGKN